MRLTLLTLSALSLLGPVVGTTISWYKSSGCSGSVYYTLYYASDSECYKFTDNASFSSVKFDSLPGGAKGQVYTSSGSCNTYGGETSSSGGCVSKSSIYSANWFYPYKRLTRKRETEPGPRHGVTYTLPDGTLREVEVPLQYVENTLNMVEEEDYEGLAKLPDVSFDSKVTPQHECEFTNVYILDGT